MESNREVIESPMHQGVSEKISYTLDVSPWGNNPSVPNVKIYSMSYGQKIDTTSINISGSPIVSGNIITLPIIQNLISKIRYCVDIGFSIEGNDFFTYMIIIGEDVI